MTPLLFYFLKQLAIAGLCFAYYGLVLRNKGYHQRSRWFLVGSVLAAILLPLVPASWPWTQQNGFTLPLVIQAIQLPEVQVAANGTAAPGISLPRFEMLYALLAGLLLLRVGYNCWRIWRLRSQSELTRDHTVTLARNSHVGLPFSFFNCIFWNAGMPVHNDTGTQILQHELVHVRQHHSADKLLLELVCACCWINPFFYLYRRELALVHEFLADEGAAADKARYAETILHAAFEPAWALTNSFFHPPIQRRIQMLFSKPTKISLMKKLALLPLGVLLVAIMSCQQSKDGASPAIPPPPPPANPEVDLSSFPADSIASMNVINKDSITITLKDGRIIHTNSAQVHAAYTPKPGSTTPAGVFTMVEHPPHFQGGETAMNKYLADNIHYPKAAVAQNREGTVFVQFIVDADGSIRDARVIGKPHPDLDEEAMRVVSKMPAWVPGIQNGKAVSVQFNLPVKFVLSNKISQQIFITVPWLKEITKPRNNC